MGFSLIFACECKTTLRITAIKICIPFYVIKWYSLMAWIRKGPDSQVMTVMLEELEGG